RHHDPGEPLLRPLLRTPARRPRTRQARSTYHTLVSSLARRHPLPLLHPSATHPSPHPTPPCSLLGPAPTKRRPAGLMRDLPPPGRSRERGGDDGLLRRARQPVLPGAGAGLHRLRPVLLRGHGTHRSPPLVRHDRDHGPGGAGRRTAPLRLPLAAPADELDDD